MAKRDDVSSTEQLLELIRSDQEPADPAELPAPTARKRTVGAFPKLLPKARKGMTVGVDFGEDAVRFIRLRRQSDRQWELLSYSAVPHNPSTRKNPNELETFLKDAIQEGLKEIRGSEGRHEIWAILPSSQTDIRLIRIPKTPRNQIANAAYWTFKKDVPSTDIDKDIFDFEMVGDVEQAGITYTDLIAYRAPRAEVRRLADLFSRAGFDLSGICLPSFAMQNLFRTGVAPTGDEAFASLYVGGEWTFVEVFSSGHLVLSRAIKTGMNRLLQDVVDGMSGIVGEQAATSSGEGEKGRPAIDAALARDLLFSLNRDAESVAGPFSGPDVPGEDVFQMVTSTLDRLARKIDASLEYYAHNLGKGQVDRIYVSGEAAAYDRIAEYIQDEVGRPCARLDPFSPGGNRLTALQYPPSPIERARYVEAMGAALSRENWTPNLLLPFEVKETNRANRRISMGILGSFTLAAAMCLAVFAWQGHGAAKNRGRLDALNQELAGCRQLVEKGRLLALADEIKQTRLAQKEYGHRYKAMAVLGELTRITPPDIRLVDVSVQMERPMAGDKKKIPSRMTLEGLVFGERQRLESSLAAYLVKLEGMPIFKDPAIRKREVEPQGKESALRFVAEVEIL